MIEHFILKNIPQNLDKLRVRRTKIELERFAVFGRRAKQELFCVLK